MKLLSFGLMLLVALSVYAVAGSLLPSTIVVQWSTANEVNTAGFNVYRSQSADGPAVKLNDQLLPASIDPLTGGRYRFADASVTPGQTYYYQIEDVEYSGTNTKHGPIAISAPSLWDMSRGAIWLLIAGVGALIVIARRRRMKA